MILFEITTGWTGESYERCYAWAKNEENARLLFSANNKQREIRDITPLMNAEEGEFITDLSDCGWEYERG